MTDPKDTYDLADVPSAADYKRAFLACKPALKSKGGWSFPMEMLKENYYAEEHTLTAGALAKAVGLADHQAANLKFGTYAKALCKELERDPEFKLAILVKFSGGKPKEELVRWTLLPQVVEALEELGWVRPDRTHR
jgi:hypothetical protein